MGGEDGFAIERYRQRGTQHGDRFDTAATRGPERPLHLPAQSGVAQKSLRQT